MSNSLSIHFHLKHYKESGLPFTDYMFLLLYENKEDWMIKEIMEVLNLKERQTVRIRNRLTDFGYLKKNSRGKYELTDKMYKQ